MNFDAYQYRNGQVCLALDDAYGLANHERMRNRRDTFPVRQLTAALYHGHGSAHEPRAGLYRAEQILLATGYDATGIYFG